MKPNFRILSLSILFIAFTFALQAQSFMLKQSHENGLYQKGENIRITADLIQNIHDTLWVTVRKNNNHLILEKTIVPEQDKLIIFESSFKEACSVMVEVKMKEVKQAIGLIVDPYRIKAGTSRPKDFDKYWANEKEKLNALRMEVKLKAVDSSELGFACFDTEINCTGPKPARGYFAKPESASAKSLPIVLLVHAAGVKGSWCRSETRDALRYARMGTGALCFDLNAHGMLNGQPDEYYNKLEAGELKDYFSIGLENKEEFYFRGMYLRLIRTIEFLCRQPEWDGKRILVIGESQGGGQALAAAGLDPRVSAVLATVPAMCDWGGTLVNRKGGWPQPFERSGDMGKMKATLPYFDAAHLLKNAKATLVVEIGLIDNTCPSTSVYAAINQAKVKKIIYPVPYREHSWPNEAQHPEWFTTVEVQKNAFVANYLK